MHETPATQKSAALSASRVNWILSLFRKSPDAKAFSTNFVWLIADKVTRLLVALFVSAWVARYLGPERFGLLAYGLTFVAMFQAISLMGLDNLIVRDVAADDSQAHRYLGTALRLRFCGAATAYMIMATTAVIFHQDDRLTVAIIALAGLSIFVQVSDVIDLWFQSQVQSRRTVLAKAASYFATAAIKVVMITSGAGVVAFAGANALEAGLSAIALYFTYKRFPTKNRWCWDTTTAVSLLRQSWPLLLSGLSIFLYMRISVILLRQLAGSAEVGIYTVGTTLSEMWYFIPMALASSLAPFISRKRMEGGDAYKRFLFKIFGFMWYFALLVAALNILLSSLWVGLLYGPQYQKSASVFAIHALTFVPVCLGVMQSLWLINEGRSKLALYQALSGAVVAVCLNLLLTPLYGAHGAAAATVVSQFAQAFLVNAIIAPDLFRLQVSSLRISWAFKS